jgi:RNA polymerase sigma factor (sigma-70 family)
MHELDDNDLLRQYAEHSSEAAFAALVSRHVDKVYSTALRHTRNAHAAEEITQAVFVILTRKANKLSQHAVLSGWLYETARLTALTFIRSEIRRTRREQEAHMQTALNETESEAWPHIAPLLDDALAKLSAADRHAIVLRYFDGKSLGEVGAALGASEDAAKKRVTRAVEKLRGWFTKRGVTLTATVLTAAISANSVQAAPLGLATTVTAAVVKETLTSASLTTLVKGTMKTMTWLKIKFSVCLGAATVLVGSAASVALSGNQSEDAVGSLSSAFQLRIVLNAVSADSEVFALSTTNSKSGDVFQEKLNVQRTVLLDGSAIQSAFASTNSLGAQQIDFTLTPKGKKQFAKATRENIGRRLAIIIDGKVVSAPVIRAEIPGGKGIISGSFTGQEATNIAAMISKSTKLR